MIDELVQRKKEIFLDTFGKVGNLTTAALAAGVSRSYHYRWLEEDPEYPARYAEKVEEAADRLEAEAFRRAVIGIDEPVIHQGRLSTVSDPNAPGGFRPLTVKKHSDVLLIFLMKGAMPEKYRDKLEHTGRGGGPIQFQGAVLVIDGNEEEYVAGLRRARSYRQTNSRPAKGTQDPQRAMGTGGDPVGP